MALVAPSVASQAAAPPKNPPGIKATKAYKVLRTNVYVLRAKQNRPATAGQKAAMRKTLAARHTMAAVKVNALFEQRLDVIAYQSAKLLAAKAKGIKRDRARVVNALDNQLDNRLARLRTAKQNAQASARARYADEAEDLIAQRKALRKRLVRTKNPVKREAIIERIDAIQDQINTLNTEKQEALIAIAARYDTKMDVTEAKYARLIDRAKRQAREAVAAARVLVKSRQRARSAAAHRRRATELAQVKGLYERGLGYIEHMPEPPAA